MNKRTLVFGGLLAVTLAGASTAFARSAFDFDVKHIPVSYITRDTNPAAKAAGTVSAGKVWLGAEGRIEVSVTLQNLNNQVVFAQGSSSNPAAWELLVVNGQWRLGYGGQYYYAGGLAVNTKYDIVCERKDGKLSLIVNDQTLVDQKPVGELATAEGLSFFHRKTSDWNDCASTMKFHSAKVYNAGVLVADYVPFVYNLFGSGGLMNTLDATADDVTGAFYYDWNERATEIDKRLCSVGKSENGTEVDWVSSSGNEFVQTDFVPASTDVIKMKLALTDDTAHYAVFSAGGAGPAGSRRKTMGLLCLSSKTWRPSFDEGDGTAGGSWAKNTDYEIEYSKAGGLKVNGNVCGTFPSSSGTFTPTFGLTFFSRLQLSDINGTPNPLDCPAKCKVYWAKVYAADGTTLKADFVPYVDGDGFAGLKDRVSGKVFLPLFGRLAASSGARPAAVYVASDASGDDTNAGTVRSPLRTIGFAYLVTSTGGTLYLKDGVYNISSTAVLEGENRAHAVVGISGDPAKVIIDGSQSNGQRAFTSRNQANGLFKNLTFRNFRINSTGAAIHSEGAQIENCVFTNNEVSTSNAGIPGGVVYAVGGRISRCAFRNNRSTGNSALGAAVLMSGSCLLENCVLEGNVSDGPEGRCCTVYIAGGSASIVRNCTFVKNRAVATADGSTAGIRCDSWNARIVNTVFCGNEHSLGASLTHSVVYMVAGYLSSFTACAAEFKINGGCRVVDSGAFADWDGGDYAPQEMSRLINRGNPYLGADAQPEEYGTDLAGNSRFVGKCIDIGAYEWQGEDPQVGFGLIVR